MKQNLTLCIACYGIQSCEVESGIVYSMLRYTANTFQFRRLSVPQKMQFSNLIQVMNVKSYGGLEVLVKSGGLYTLLVMRGLTLIYPQGWRVSGSLNIVGW